MTLHQNYFLLCRYIFAYLNILLSPPGVLGRDLLELLVEAAPQVGHGGGLLGRWRGGGGRGDQRRHGQLTVPHRDGVIQLRVLQPRRAHRRRVRRVRHRPRHVETSAVRHVLNLYKSWSK